MTAKNSPILKLHIHPDIKRTSVRYKHIQYNFSNHKHHHTFITHFLNFPPTKPPNNH
ncbi:Csa1 family protein [Staphylococcus aureus]|uniref:Csa1 family protein n=1 Tax=Staphylococcus aureus TaxID=1280 RepID=UPI0021B2F1D9|nr:Csa1 family protein [Staphylococcus aureus]